MPPSEPIPSENVNPYAPVALEEPEVIAPVASTALPRMHWSMTFAIFVVMMFLTFITYGFMLPAALSILVGGIRTAAVYRACNRAGVVPPAYWGQAILSPIACMTLFIGSGVLFLGICSLGGLPMASSAEISILILSATISLVVYILLIYASIKLTVATCRRKMNVGQPK